ncbi:sulfur carrier protein ThiS [Roseovarius autotrophicus]|uniref:sulfur carrier protein ThiS n=1 Tax=Roseovarius autotrophicus TaxID=2824121 RepID=UPI0019E3635E|nr:sulfur carrier protein ThiS [Roseovarius autotrophicus]MBE0453044.1 sulfur carrier protein ThiS [Roseovarius sp.]
MKITVNGTARETAAPTLAALLIEMDLGMAKVATALNEGFVPAPQRAATPLADGDRVEIVAPRQGG